MWSSNIAQETQWKKFSSINDVVKTEYMQKNKVRPFIPHTKSIPVD